MSESEQELQYKKLREGYSPSLREEACLALLSPRYATCRACEGICPVQAIRVGETALELAESCLNCGRCAAVCPMGALALPGFTIPEIKPQATKPVAVDCWKVPREKPPDDAVRVPCLGGLSAGRIIDLVALAGQHAVVLLDRGWCAKCHAGGGNVHPATAALGTARSLLEKAGMSAGELPRIEIRHLPEEQMPTEIPGLITQQQLSRRAFFGALVSQAAVAIDQVKPLTSQSEVRRKRGFEREPVLSSERNRLLYGMQQIVQRTGKTLPSGLFHRLEISDACRNHLLCAKICPTGALDIRQGTNSTGLMFDGTACIACGHCVTVCPSDAVWLLPDGNNPMPVEPVQLTRFSEQDCPECGRSYPVSINEEVCPQCVKRRQLASSAFHALFGGEA